MIHIEAMPGIGDEGICAARSIDGEDLVRVRVTADSDSDIVRVQIEREDDTTEVQVILP